MNEMSVLEINHLVQKFGSTTVLDDLSLNIKKGEIFGLLGPSGSGKTTLVKAMVGMGNFNSGEVHVLGTKMPNLSMVVQMGYMAQSDALYEDLNALEHLQFFGSIFGMSRADIHRRSTEILEWVDLIDHKNKKTLYFSGGMKRRLSLAIALFHEPNIMILDEPTVGIDPVLRKQFWDKFEDLRDEGKSIIITTHVMDEAIRCDRLAMIRDGNFIAIGPPKDLMNEIGATDLEEVFLHYSCEKKGSNHELDICSQAST